jgi:large conductance mechanosensitive channel
VRSRDTDRGYHARRAWECCEGNVLDLAIAVVVGAAFTRIVDSLVGDIIMPFIGAMTGGVDFSNYFLPVVEGRYGHKPCGSKETGRGVIVVNFLIIAWALFLVVKAINQLKQPKAETAPPPPRQEVLPQEIRDALVKR